MTSLWKIFRNSFFLAIFLSVAAPVSADTYSFKKNLSIGDRGGDVLYLQRLLNNDPQTVLALSGPGSQGHETEYFGPATQRAVIKFQRKYAQDILTPGKLSSPTGIFGPLSRARMIKLGTRSVVASAVPVAPVVSGQPTIVSGGGSTASNHSPTISLVGASPLSVTAGETFTDPGATASDVEDGTITSSITTSTNLDTKTVGSYSITYSVTDSRGATASASRTVTVTGLPDLAGSTAPSSNPSFPAGFDTFSPPVVSTTTSNSAPIFAEWTKSAQPDDTLAVTGDNLSQFITYGQTASGDKTFKDAAVQSTTTVTSAITLSGSLPSWSTYFVWPKNTSGYGYPIAVNKTDAWWIGPRRATRGDTVSIFGRNLSHANATSQSWVYIQPSSGTGEWATVTSVNPYKVSFTVPSDLTDGVYQVWVHNGHGGSYGWSGPLSLYVDGGVVWSGPTFNVRDYGAVGNGIADDGTAIENAYYAAGQVASSTVYFPAGTYNTTKGYYVWPHVRWLGDGSDSSIINFISTSTTDFLLASGVLTNFSEFSHLTLKNDHTIRASMTTAFLWFRDMHNLFLNNVKIDSYLSHTLDFNSSVAISVKDSDITGDGTFMGNASQVSFDNDHIYGRNDTNVLIDSWGGSDISVTNCTVQNFDDSNPYSSSGWSQGRFYSGNGVWGTQKNVYIGNNTTVNLAIRAGAIGNTGEQLLWEGNYTTYAGSPSSATSNTVTINGLGSVGSDQVAIVSGKGLGQYRKISSFDAGTGTITLETPWNVVPDTSSGITITTLAHHVAIYNNDLDGRAENVATTTQNASAGIELYGGTFDFIGDNNRFTDIVSTFVTAGVYGTDGISPVFSSLFTHNSSTYGKYGSLMLVESRANSLGSWGNIFRSNTYTNMTTSVRQIQTYGTGTAILMNVLEHETATGSPTNFTNLTPSQVSHLLEYKNAF